MANVRWQVTFILNNGHETTVDVIALNKSDAEYRAAMKWDSSTVNWIHGIASVKHTRKG